MDIRKIALFLAGKLPPYYGKSNLRSFTKKLRDFAPEEFTNEEMLFIQTQAKNIDEEVYFNILDDVWSEVAESDAEGKKTREDFVVLLKSLGVNDEVLGIGESESNSEYTWDAFLEKVKEIYGEDFSNIDIGGYFEELCKELLIKEGFVNVKIAGAGADGGIDITADKEILIGNNTKKVISFVGQSKYKTTGNVTKSEVNDLITPIINDTNNMYQGILFFTNRKYQSNAKQELENTQSSRINLKSFYLDGDEILDIMNKYPNLIKKFKK